jgi:hypothetical protein
MTKPTLGDGDVVIILKTTAGEDQELTLRCTYGAAQYLSKQNGGYTNVVRKLLELDLDVHAQVVAAGLGMIGPGKRPAADLAQRIYMTGLTDDTGGLTERCVTFIRALSGGGRLPAAVEEATADEDRPT